MLEHLRITAPGREGAAVLVQPADGPVVSIDLGVHPRALGPLPEGELGIVLWTFVLSLAAGFAVKGLFGVTL